MLTLDSNLSAAQDTAIRKPIVEIKSISPVADIPFDGQYLRSDQTEELHPNVAYPMHSTGRICKVTIRDGKVRYTFSDIPRTQFNYVDLALPGGADPIEADIAELPSGNLGIACYAQAGGNEIIYAFLISPTGGILYGPAEILSYSSGTHAISSPTLCLASGATMTLAYVDATGGNYYFRARTTADFEAWSAEGTLSISGLTASKRVANLCMRKISTGQVWLWFDYLESVSGSNELTNVYYSNSDDGGATWNAAVKFTDYATYSARGEHPVAAQKVAGQMHVVFNEIASMLTMKGGVTSGWTGGSGASSYVHHLQVDHITHKLYLVTFIYIYAFPEAVGVFKIDLDTWTIEKNWNYSSVPAIPVYWRDTQEHIGNLQAKMHATHGERHLIPWFSTNVGWRAITLLDAESDTITSYYFEDHPGWNPPADKNVDSSGPCDTLNSVWVDYESLRIYVLMQKYNFVGTCYWSLGYISLEDTAEVKTYHEIQSGTLNLMEFYFQGYYTTRGCLQMETASDLALLFWGYRTMAIRISDGTILKEYSYTTPPYSIPAGADPNPNYPAMEGLKAGIYANGKIYGVYRFIAGQTPAYETEGWDGFCEIDLTTDNIVHRRPDWDPLPDGGRYHYDTWPNVISIGSGQKILLSQYGLGIAIFDVSSGTWRLLDNETVPGLLLVWTKIEFDPTTEMLYVGVRPDQTTLQNLEALSINGLLNIPQYSVGTYSAPNWAWSDPEEFIIGTRDRNAVMALHPTDKTIYAFWARDPNYTAWRIAWDTEASEINLTGLIRRGSDVTYRRSIEGKPAELKFSVGSGELFDPYNRASLYSIYLRKGRKISLRFGEMISGSPVWQAMGEFYVDRASISYSRPTAPVMEIVARDRLAKIERTEVVATEYFQALIEDILSSILQDHGGFDPGDIDIPALPGSEMLYAQWIDSGLKGIIDQLCERGFAYSRMDVNGKFSPRTISRTNPVDHQYSDLTKISEWTPDDSFSDFTNRLTVRGFSRSQIAVTFPEERIESINGTCGWWGFRKEYRINYSQDGSRRCVQPRLVTLESAQSIAFQLAGSITESITEVDENGYYCVVTVEAPNLIPVLIAAIALSIAGFAMPDGVTVFGVGASGGVTIPIGSLVQQAGMLLALTVLASVGNFQFEIWARPKGYVKAQIQAISDDPDLQAEIGEVIPKAIDDDLCYTQDACQRVADFEMGVLIGQRKRISLRKAAHLQDEDGDTIEVPHPVTGDPKRIFITDLTRRYRMPAGESRDGHFMDEIEGWDVTP